MTLRTLVLAYLAIILMPLALAWAGPAPPRPLRDELASGAGILAFSIILAEFLLSGRFRSVSGGVGLDVTLRLHQLVARSALVLALVHPFLYQAPFAPPLPWDTTRQLTLTTDFKALASGIGAWLLLPSLVLLAIARSQLSYRYEAWRLMHGVGAALIAGLVLHHALAAGRYSDAGLLAGLWWGMSGIALMSLVFVYGIGPLRQLQRPWRVAQVTPLGPRLWELSLDPRGHAGLNHLAGQFVWLNVGHTPFSLYENPFSISSAPGSGSRLRFVIKEQGDFTATLRHIGPGARAYLDGPHGHLTIAGRPATGIALIAGGVGIAPLISIARQMKLDGDRRPVILIYANRAQDQIVHREELEELRAELDMQVVHVLSEPPPGWTGEVGLIDADRLSRTLGTRDIRDWLFVICGPPPMMTEVEDALSAMGIPSARVLSERFSYD